MVTTRGNQPAETSRPASVIHLTPRQTEVLRLITAGLGHKQIARRLGISARAVDDHFAAMRARTGARNNGELIARALQTGAIGNDAIGKEGPGTGTQPGPGPARRDETPPAAPSARDETRPVSSHCQVCGTPITTAGTGRPRTYCCRACQARAYRTRHRQRMR